MSLIFYFCSAYALTNKTKSWHFLESRPLQKSSHGVRLWAMTVEVELDGAWPSLTVPGVPEGQRDGRPAAVGDR